MNRRTGLLLVGGLSLAVVVSVAALPRIPQDPEYHQFADRRTFLGLPNFFNVVSNAPFVLVGGLGLCFVWGRILSSDRKTSADRWVYWPYVGFFFGAFLTGFGSAYYHLLPNNGRLVWDRLPMAIIFMSFLTSIIAERISLKTGLFSLLPLLILGTSSVIYWHMSEQTGAGDLRPYILVQFYPLLLIPLLLFFFSPKYTRGGDIWGVLACYALAKTGEILDRQIFALEEIVSGHTAKHLFAAAAVYWVLRMIRKRDYMPAKDD